MPRIRRVLKLVQTTAVSSRLDTLISGGSPEIALDGRQLLVAGVTPAAITAQFGSPLYIYSERIIRARCREIAGFLPFKPFVPVYSCKANTNISLLKIVHEEGMHADAMSPGEILLLREAGFRSDEICYVGNNVDDAELLYALEAGVTTSVDSLAQLERFGRLNPGGRVAVRVNPGMGDGHHKKVVTGGADAKFGVYYTDMDRVKEIVKRCNLRLVGLNQHIGSNFLTREVYLASVHRLLSMAERFDDLDFVDFGGGFGVPYQNGIGRLDLASLGRQMAEMLEEWTAAYGKRITVQCEPGRYIVCESGALFITVNSVKQNPGILFVGTDGGFNVLQRPVMYGAYHEIINSRLADADEMEKVPTSVCGNICESGDLLCEGRPLPRCSEDDVLVVLDAGAYGHSMSSNYNARLRPAEVLVTTGGDLRLVRERDTLEDILRHQLY